MQGILTERRNPGSTTLGVILIALGVIALLAPLFAAVAVIGIIKWLLIFAAIEQLIYAFQTRNEGGLFFKVLLGALYGVAGVMLLSRPVAGVVAATALIGFLLIADGITEIVLGVQLRRTYDTRIGWLFAGGILSLILGGLIVLGLPRSVVGVGLLVGIRLVFKGMEHIVRSSMERKIDHIVERKVA